MTTRHLYIARHGEADAFGGLTETGRRQADLLGRRLADIPMDSVWHSPLPRAAESAHAIARHLPSARVAEAPELIDNIPYVPPRAETPSSWIPFFDGYDAAEAEAGHRLAQRTLDRFASTPDAADAETHELLVTHAYPIAWLVRAALEAPPARWLGLNAANTGLTVIDFRTGLPPAIVMFNDLGHLEGADRWTGFPPAARP